MGLRRPGGRGEGVGELSEQSQQGEAPGLPSTPAGDGVGAACRATMGAEVGVHFTEWHPHHTRASQVGAGTTEPHSAPTRTAMLSSTPVSTSRSRPQTRKHPGPGTTDVQAG